MKHSKGMARGGKTTKGAAKNGNKMARRGAMYGGMKKMSKGGMATLKPN